jgi:penicillin-binding protein 1A
MGYDEKKTLGPKETGARAALPVWMDFMKVALAAHETGEFQAAPAAPANPVAQKVDTPDAAPSGEESH